MSIVTARAPIARIGLRMLVSGGVSDVLSGSLLHQVR